MFTKPSLLRKHLASRAGLTCAVPRRRNDNRGDEGEHACPECAKSFTFSYNLNRHLREVHGKNSDGTSWTRGANQCTSCLHVYSRLHELMRHKCTAPVESSAAGSSAEGGTMDPIDESPVPTPPGSSISSPPTSPQPSTSHGSNKRQVIDLNPSII